MKKPANTSGKLQRITQKTATSLTATEIFLPTRLLQTNMYRAISGNGFSGIGILFSSKKEVPA